MDYASTAMNGYGIQRGDIEEQRVRLRHSDPWGPGIRRRGRGRGFQYTDVDGTTVSEPQTLERIRALAIPPAWRNVWISPHENGHIQAVGVDDAGRRQYIYHEQWRRERDADKHDRVLRLAPLLPEWRCRISNDMRTHGLSRTRVLGTGLFILDRGIFRTGNERYAEDHSTYGVATLLREHVHVRGDECFFHYLAKGGIERAVSIRDRTLAEALKALLRSRSPSDRLLRYRDGAGWHETTAEDLNALFKSMLGEEFTVKDLRTWNATVLAATAFARAPMPTSPRACARVTAGVMREVAEGLGNTPAVARHSYVDPRVIHCYEQGTTIRMALRRLANHRLQPHAERAAIEKALVRMLNKAK